MTGPLRLGCALFALVLSCVAPSLAEDATEEMPLPSARPNDQLDPKAKVPLGDGVEEDGQAAEEPPVWQLLVQSEESYAACLDDLKAFGTTFGELPAILDEEDRDCGIRRPVEIRQIVPGVEMQPDAVMRCPTARALASWVAAFVLPASVKLPDRGPVTVIEHGSTYVCKRRDNAPAGKLSEHAFGNAIDVMGFRFASGDPIPVQPRMRDGTMAEAFQRGVRASACLDFSTVLGPGTDAAHADHLHLDVKERRGDFRLCQ